MPQEKREEFDVNICFSTLPSHHKMRVGGKAPPIADLTGRKPHNRLFTFNP
jgi:hypothetical protein